jgi:ABC-type nitrate/sulfonate/bicarbonate transport system substrate-binding protein
VICTPSDKHSLSRRDALKGAALALTAGAASWPLHAIAGAESEPEEVRLAQAGPGSADTITRPLIERGGPELTKGLRLSWVESNPGQIQLQLLSGALNIGAFGSIGAAIAVEHGTDIVLIGPSLNNHGRWIVRDNSPYRSPKDLIGKRIATQPETTETFLQARIAAALAGLDLKRDFQLFFGPPTANLALFERGDVDAVILLEPTATRLVAAGAREIARVGDMWQEATGDSAPPFLAGRAAQRGWLDAHRALAKRIVDIEVEVNRQVVKNPQLLAELHGAMGIPDSERAAIELLPKRLAGSYATEWGPDVFEVIDRQINVAVKLGILTARPASPIYATL